MLREVAVHILLWLDKQVYKFWQSVYDKLHDEFGLTVGVYRWTLLFSFYVLALAYNLFNAEYLYSIYMIVVFMFLGRAILAKHLQERQKQIHNKIMELNVQALHDNDMLLVVRFVNIFLFTSSCYYFGFDGFKILAAVSMFNLLGWSYSLKVLIKPRNIRKNENFKTTLAFNA